VFPLHASDCTATAHSAWLWIFQTNETKEAWLLETLRHKMVTCMEPQADAFREGVLTVVNQDALDLLTPKELGEMWSGSGIDDATMLRWQAAAGADLAIDARVVAWFWEVCDHLPCRSCRSCRSC
jgi:hypothetical protein